MITYKTVTPGLLEAREEIPCLDASMVFNAVRGSNDDPAFIFESKEIAEVYGRLSIIGIEPVLKLTGKDNQYSLEKLKRRADAFDLSSVSGAKNQVDQIRLFVEKNRLQQRVLLGLYGGFSYDFVRQFEDIGNSLPANDVNDYTLFLFDTFIFFDHLKQCAEIVIYRQTTQEAEADLIALKTKLKSEISLPKEFSVTNTKFSFDQAEYEKLVRSGQELARQGELFEVVFANTLKANYQGDPFALYLHYRDRNPAPYLFYFNFGDEQLVGASPEMMVRVENNRVHLRPISGTAKRGDDPVADHQQMLNLLNDPKERAELDMLIDLGRNDLSRVCKPGLTISDYRFVEKYSRVMHTISHITGELADDKIAFDALTATLNAGTLTGAPKISAMQAIEKHERERRGYYGGAIGYLTLANELNTGIIIRTAHLKNGSLNFKVGATLLYDSDPAAEYQETMAKAQAFLETIASLEKPNV